MGDYATNIAIIQDGFVVNVIWGYIYQMDEFNHNNQIAVQIDDLGVRVGDTYVDGVFYDENGNVIKSMSERYEDTIEELDNFIIDALYEDIIDDIDEEE